MLKTLLPFQSVGAKFLATHPHALLADQPGLGKTVQAIAAAEILGLKKLAIVCPASVRSGWLRELDECGYKGEWTIISYNGVNGEPGTYIRAQGDHDGIILDEAHFLKTVDSQRTQGIFGNRNGLARSGRLRVRWCLTGTPVLNRPVELYPFLKSLHRPFSGMSWGEYGRRFCDAHFDARGMNVRGASNLEELSTLLDGFMLRRTKRQVFPDRKEPLVSWVPLDVTAEDQANILAEEERIGAREARLSPTAEGISGLGDTSRLLRLLGEAKVRAACAFIEDQLETVDKVCVFAYHTKVTMDLRDKLAARGFGPVVYVGGMSDALKDDVKATFVRNPACRVFIGQRQAAGQGVDGLQKVSSTAVIVEPPWGPEELVQIVGRLDRMEQADDIVNAYVLYAPNTLDEAVKGVNSFKADVIRRVVRATAEGVEELF